METDSVQPSSIKYSAGENSITAVFPAEDMALGAYDIVITNPGGLTRTLEGFSVGFSRPLDITVSLGPNISPARLSFRLYMTFLQAR